MEDFVFDNESVYSVGELPHDVETKLASALLINAFGFAPATINVTKSELYEDNVVDMIFYIGKKRYTYLGWYNTDKGFYISPDSLYYDKVTTKYIDL